MKVMTTKEITEQLQRAMDLGVLKADDDIHAVTFNTEFANVSHSEDVIYKLGANTLAHLVLEGKYDLDIDRLQMVCAQREAQIKKEADMLERRGGLTHEDLADKIMQGIVNGALDIYYGEIAPYSHGYEVSFKPNPENNTSGRNVFRWGCYCGLFDISETIASKIEFADVYGFNVNEMISSIDDMESKQIKSFTPEKETNFERWGTRYPGSRGSIASVKDVHAGKGLDGIVKHHYHGDYSSMTPCKQNELCEALVFLKGFCLDCLYDENLRNPVNGIRGQDLKGIVDYLEKHGTDITTPEKLAEWIKNNPEKCGREENRVVKQFNEGHELYAKAYCDLVELKSIIGNHTGSFEELRDILGGYNYDGELFDFDFDILCVTVENIDGKAVLNETNVDIYKPNSNILIEEHASFNYIKETCEEIGFDIKDLEAKALGKDKGKALSLDKQIKDNASKVVAPEGVQKKPVDRGEL